MLGQDFRYALRTLAKNPGFATVAVLALALGIGANCAIFSVVNAVLLRPLPYPEPERLVQVSRKYPRGYGNSASFTKFLFWKEHNQSFESMCSFDFLGAGANLTGTGEPERVRSVLVTHEFFRVFGTDAHIGRTFTPAEDRPGAGNVAVISDGLWKRRFASDPSVVGRSVTLNSEPYTIIGVLRAGFEHTSNAEVFMPLRPVPSATDRAHAYNVVARLKPGITVGMAQQDMDRVAQMFWRQYPNLQDKGSSETIGVRSYHEVLVGDVRPALLILLGAVGLVLLIACANVANLLLARASTRTKEIAIRASLGAGRGRIVRQLLTESVILAGVGGVVGLVAAHWGIKALLAASPANLPRIAQVQLDWRVLLFAFGASVLTGIVFGILPALQASKLNLNDTLKDAGRGSTGGASRGFARNVLVVAEVALSLVLLVGAALLIQSFRKLREVDTGFDPKNVLTLQMSLGKTYSTTAKVWNMERTLLQRLETIPGIVKSGTITNLPLEDGPDLPFNIEGDKKSDANNPTGDAQYRAASPRYFDAMTIPMRIGRSFRDSDEGDSQPVIIVNEAFSKQYFKDRNALGERITIGRLMGPAFADSTRVVVGVVGNNKEYSLSQPAPPTMFVPEAQVPDSVNALINAVAPKTFVLKTAVAPLSVVPFVRREVLSVDPNQAVSNIRTMEEVLGTSLSSQRFNMLLLALFAGLALVLSVVGIYGVMSYAVSQRTHEIGIRMALGASTRETLGMVLRQAMTLAGLGVMLGIAGALAGTRVLARMLFGVTATDPVTFVVVPVVLLAAAFVASYLPARRATRIDPLVALRYE